MRSRNAQRALDKFDGVEGTVASRVQALDCPKSTENTQIFQISSSTLKI
jgi:hypothetical protein